MDKIVAPRMGGEDWNMQAIDLGANLEGNVKAVLFTGTAFAVFGQDRPNREKSLQL